MAKCASKRFNMSYAIYTTPGLVLSRRGVGERHFMVRILTRDLGLISAKAISARAPLSKLRPGTTPFSTGLFSFVRGKECWRMTSFQPDKNAYFNLGDKREHKILLGKIARVVSSMAPLGEPAAKLFDIVQGGITGLPYSSREALPLYELAVMTRILDALGYIPDHTATRPVLESEYFDSSLAKHIKDNAPRLRTFISQAFSASHLT